MGDLTSELGINRPSLYAAYGDKEQLFHEVLSHYHETVTASDRLTVASAECAKDLVQQLLASCVARISGHQFSPGYLMSGAMADLSCLSEGLVSDITERLTGFEEQTADRYESFGVALEEAQQRAAKLVFIITGLSTYARSIPDPAKPSRMANSFTRE
ncbi:TetR/AcrR family transcriptional regulator [Ruegeria sp.]|uniref:TetR/AcrR family transcriptional regulator n=1 Tax=Ruegeria sp. TaxID=1879320 RepID=UPI003C7AA279